MTSTGTEKYARISIMLVKGGTQITRRVFEKRVLELTPNDRSSSPWTVDEFLLENRRKILDKKTGREKEKIYFPGVSYKTNLNIWDLSMFCHVLLESADVNRTIRMDIDMLRKLRNKLSHLSDPSLDERKYEDYLDKIEVIFGRLSIEIGDVAFDKHIKDILQSCKDEPLSTTDAVRQMHTFYLMDGGAKEILTEHTKDHSIMLDKLDTLLERTDPKGIEFPDTDVEIVIKNCNSEKEKRLSELLKKMIDENINKANLLDELSNESCHKLREAVDQAVKKFLSSGRQITSTERKCVLLRVKCFSAKDLVNLFRDCISGKLNQQLGLIEAAVKQIPEFEEVSMEAVIYEEEFWNVMEKTVSELDAYISETTRQKSSVTLQQTQSSTGSYHSVKVSIPTKSAGHLEELKKSFESGSVKKITDDIQLAACEELNLNNVSIEARLPESKKDDHDVQTVYRKFTAKSKKRRSKQIKGKHPGQRLPKTNASKRISLSMAVTSISYPNSLGSSEKLNELPEQENFNITDLRSESDDSGVGTDTLTSSSFHDSSPEAVSPKNVSAIDSDDTNSVCSKLSYSESQSDDDNENVFWSEQMSEESYGAVYEKIEERQDSLRNDKGRDEYLIQHGIKLNESFLAKFRSKTAKHTAFYQKFKQPDELKRLLVSNPRKYISCKINVESSHEAYCIPTSKCAEEQLTRIEISGRTKIGQVYNGDEVVVELLDNKDKHERRYGQVLGVLNRHRYKNENKKHPVLLCTPDDAESHIVRPVCKTVPKINVLRDELMQQYKTKKAMRLKIEIYEYDESAEILCNPRIETLSHAEFQSCVFLVAIMSWELNQIYPRGAIIKRLPCGETLKSGLAILKLRYEVKTTVSKETTEELEELEKSISKNDCDTGAFFNSDRMKDRSDLRTFTIDRHDAKDLNFAFSLEEEANCYKVGVHIVDVSAYIKKGSPLDKDAYNRALTIHSGIDTPRFMLPEEIAVGLCSLIQKEKRPVISVYLFLGNDGKYIQSARQNYLIQSSIIRCCRNFSYEQAQQAFTAVEDDAVTRDLKSLFRLMISARKLRLQRSFHNLNSGEIELDEIHKGINDAHCVAEELAIMVNKKVAEVLIRNHLSIPVLTQQPPSTKDLESFCQQYEHYLDVLVHFQDRQISPSKMPKLENALRSGAYEKIMLSSAVWEKISGAFSPTVLDFILDDNLHPLQSVIYNRWLSIQNMSHYKCSTTTATSEEHFGLGFKKYTHCTSPTRRYTDLVVQRILHYFLEKQERPYLDGEIEEICVHANFVTGNSIRFQRDCINLQRALQFKSRADMQRCFVNDVSEQCIKVVDQSPSFACGQEVEVPLNLLDMGFKPELTADIITNLNSVVGKWRKRLYDLEKKPSIDSPLDTKNKNQHPKSENEPTDLFKRLNPYRDVTFVKLQQWARLVKNASDNHQNDLKRNIKRTVAQKEESGINDVSSECFDSSKIEANTKFSLRFHVGQSLNIRLYAKPKKGIITPQPMLFEMTDNVKLCLQHTEDPVLRLSRYSTHYARDQYRNPKEYTDIWLSIVLMEAAVNAVCNEDGCTINNVQVNVANERQGTLMLPVDFCEERNIDFSGSLNNQIEEGGQCHAYDWLCLKCKLPTIKSQTEGNETNSVQQVWVGHAEVSEVKVENVSNSIYKISFNLHEGSEAFRTIQKEVKNIKYSVEILRKTDVDRRIESNFKSFHSNTDALALKIALKRKLPPLDEGHLHLANIIERDLYINSSDPKSKPLPRNNQNQQEAIDIALRHRFMLIQGPPGTGKTYTGIKLIYLFNKINGILQKEGKSKKQVLFCGPSNKSVDLVAKWMLRRLGNHCPDFIRIYGRATEAEDFPIPGLSYQSKGNKIHRADEELHPVTLHYLIRNSGSEIGRKIIATDKEFEQYRRKRSKPSAYMIKKYQKLLAKASMDEIRKHRVLLCTTGFGSNPKLLKASNVFQVIIDEAGMCPEPQCMVPLIATKAEQIVMIGDHKQLRPIVKCKAAADLGLDKSLFERYATTKESIGPFIMLNEQYRMHPKLCEFPSTQFYKGKLETKKGLWKYGDVSSIWPTDATGFTVYPHILIHVEGEESFLTVTTDDGHEQSRSNAKELDIVINVYRYLIEENIPPYAINVVSQYNAQCSEIKNGLKKQGFTNYIVNTVVSSQGGEWDYVIFSTVRSLPKYKIETNSTIGWRKYNLGFITDTNQINVALTRARKGLIIIGNKNLLSCDPVWNKLVSHYEQRKCVKSPEEFPPPRTRQQKMKEAMLRSRQRYEDAQWQPRTPDNKAYFASKGAIPKTQVQFKQSGHTKHKSKLLPTNQAFPDYDEFPPLPENVSTSNENPVSSDHLSLSASNMHETEKRDDTFDTCDEWKTVQHRKGRSTSH